MQLPFAVSVDGQLSLSPNGDVTVRAVIVIVDADALVTITCAVAAVPCSTSPKSIVAAVATRPVVGTVGAVPASGNDSTAVPASIASVAVACPATDGANCSSIQHPSFGCSAAPQVVPAVTIAKLAASLPLIVGTSVPVAVVVGLATNNRAELALPA